ncbi:MAG: hypothetical protein COY40_00245 [Alphaproteobacteria bacterium CG_4_10_14_0_8_um_filter_53_9]|nr:MAG: hypothetical protein COY40_00245 [Alphaproteobacteria bacterium CG_4_10_14_0_8_um_filter_53_9]
MRAGTRFLFTLGLFFSLMGGAHADNWAGNAVKSRALCGQHPVDKEACVLLDTSWGLIKPFTGMRDIAAELWNAGQDARDPELRDKAKALWNGWADALGVGSQPRGKNAGILVESAFIRHVEACSPGACMTPELKRLFWASLRVLVKTTPDKMKRWNALYLALPEPKA